MCWLFLDMNKRTIYIFLFTLLGATLSLLVHAAIEIPVINLLTKDFDKYGLGFTWPQWYLIHGIVSVLLLLLGIIAGYRQGKYWWRAIYYKEKYVQKSKK